MQQLEVLPGLDNRKLSEVARLTPSRRSVARISTPSSFTVGLRSVSDEMAARTTKASKKTELTAPFSVAKHLIPGISRRSAEVLSGDRGWSAI